MKVLGGMLAVVVLFFAVIGVIDSFQHLAIPKAGIHSATVSHTSYTHRVAAGRLATHASAAATPMSEPETLPTSATSTPSFAACAQEIYDDAYGPSEKSGHPVHWAVEHPDSDSDPCGAYVTAFMAKYPSAYVQSGNHPCSGLDTSTPTPECRWGGGPDLGNKAEAVAMARWTPTASDPGTESYANQAADAASHRASDYIAPSASATSTSGFDYATAQTKLIAAMRYEPFEDAHKFSHITWDSDGVLSSRPSTFPTYPTTRTWR